MKWLGMLVDRDRHAGDIERLWTVLQDDEFCKLGVEPIKPLLMYPSILPGYVWLTGEAMTESGWYQRLDRCFLALLGLLSQVEVSRNVNATAKRLLDIAS